MNQEVAVKRAVRYNTIVGVLLQKRRKTVLFSTQTVSDNQWAYRLERNRRERKRALDADSAPVCQLTNSPDFFQSYCADNHLAVRLSSVDEYSSPVHS